MNIGYILMTIGVLMLIVIIGWAMLIAQLKFIFKTFWRCFFEVKDEYNRR